MRIASLSKAVGLLVAAGFAGIVASSWLALNELKVNGPLYERIISGKDLVADILPPPMYVIEAYLETTLLAKDPSSLANRQDTLTRLRKDYQERHDHWTKHELPPVLRDALLRTAHAPAEKMWSTIGERFIPALSRNSAAEISAIHEEIAGYYAMHRAGIEKVVKLANDLNEQVEAAAKSKLQTYTLVMIAAALGGIAIVILAVVGLTRRLVNPMLLLEAAMARLSGGDLAAPVPCAKRSDELGRMAAAVAVFRDAAVEKQRIEAEAEQHRHEVEAERVVREREKAAEAQQAHATIAALAAGLSELAHGNLTVRIDTPLAPHSEQLRVDFNEAVEKLRGIMVGVVAAAHTIRNGTSEIATGADDLAHRTEQQAANLEETAAALDEIAATVRKSAEGAAHASGAVAAARGDAETTAAMVDRTVDAMSKIASSSSEITQIIGVIDEIAFQTNLLALNAGVEAARAGDAGRGFAVVASEVRALSQRSADAAREIRGLITKAGAHVSEGVDLVNSTGEALQRIRQQVVEINGVVSDIAAGAAEQSSGLNEVSRAVNQMDQVTQQNAALVQQTNTASHSLSQETANLLDRVAQFNVGAAAERAPAPARQTRPSRPRAVPKTVGRGGAALAAQADASDAGWENF